MVHGCKKLRKQLRRALQQVIIESVPRKYNHPITRRRKPKEALWSFEVNGTAAQPKIITTIELRGMGQGTSSTGNEDQEAICCAGRGENDLHYFYEFDPSKQIFISITLHPCQTRRAMILTLLSQPDDHVKIKCSLNMQEIPARLSRKQHP